MKVISYLLTYCLAYNAASKPVAPPSLCVEDDYFTKTWADDFDGNTLASHWVATEGNQVGQLRDTWGTSDNIVVADGQLQLWTRREESHGYNFTSASLTSKDKAFWRPPFKACVIAKLPGNGKQGEMDGIWPAHWMEPQNKTCWPDLGEIDIMEQIDGKASVYSTYHWSFDSELCTAAKVDQKQLNVIVEDATDHYHEYAVHVEEKFIDFYVDNVKVGTVNENSVGDKNQTSPTLDPTTAWYMILNTAVSNRGVWPEGVDNATAFPVVHYIDSVKVLSKD